MPSTPIIQLENVSYIQQQTTILEDVSWTIEPGIHWAVLGANGSGKSTMLKLACGYLWPSRGRVLRLGRELLDLRQLRRQIGWISAEVVARVPPDETALETVVSGRLAQIGLKNFPGFGPSGADFVDARQMLVDLGCTELIDKRFAILSQGERQQVLIARARMAEPLLLVLDEPCAGMDPGVRERFLAWLDRCAIAKDGPTVVLVTHHLEEIVPGIRNTALLQSGRLVGAGPTSEVVTASAIERIYQTRLARLELVNGRYWSLWQ